MPRWHHLCQDCWQEAHPNEYLPEEAFDYDLCENCGDNTLVYGSLTAGATKDTVPSGFHIIDGTADPIIEYEAPYVPEGEPS